MVSLIFPFPGHANDRGRFVQGYQSIAPEIPEIFKGSYQKLTPQTPGAETTDGGDVLAL